MLVTTEVSEIPESCTLGDLELVTTDPLLFGTRKTTLLRREYAYIICRRFHISPYLPSQKGCPEASLLHQLKHGGMRMARDLSLNT